MRAFTLLAGLLACSLQVSAQSYSIGWYQVAGGGGTSAGASYQVTGTVGQPVAGGASTAGIYSLTGGHWSQSSTPVPEIVVEQPSGTDLADGGSKGFGNVPVNGTADLVFTIRNPGTANLTGISASIDGTDSTLFTVTSVPSDVLNPAGSTTFTVRFAPLSTGVKNAALHIASNDADENPFDILLSGTGVVPAPEIVVEQPAETDLIDGGSKGFGNVAVNSTADLIFTIRNMGTANLTGVSVSVDGTDAGQFTVTSVPSDVLNPAGSTTFTVRFAPVSTGLKSAALHIASNDADENPFDINLTGTGTPDQLTARENNRSWRGVVSSADGKKMVAVGNNTYVYTSTDSGVNWTENTSTGQKSWYAVASSADGVKLVAVADGSRIYTSTDSGVNWTQQNGTSAKQWRSVASSADGTKLIAGVFGEQLFTSIDSGVNWTVRNNNRNWSGVASSADGTKLVAVVQNGKIYTSVDSGANWTERMSDLSRQWYGVASSADGTKLVACVNNGQIYTSVDSGANWTARESSRSWRSVASSHDGTKLVAAEQNGQIHVSTDSGVNWSAIDSARNWYSVATSADGSVLVAAVFGGQLYTAGTPGDVFQAGPNFVVNQLGDHDDGVAGTGDCTLREAIHAANANPDSSVITFDATLFATAQTLQLAGVLPALDSDLEIQGPTAGVTVRRNTGGDYRILQVNWNKTVALSRLTLSNGNQTSSGGGGIKNYGTLTISDCVITGNTASGEGGGIESFGQITMSNCTLSGNHGNWGGGIATWWNATVTGCTISGNSANTAGGGMLNGNNTLTLRNSVISGNTAPSGGGFDTIGEGTLINVTISGNTATGSTTSDGGGAMSLSADTLLESCTLTGNTAPNAVSGIRGGIWLKSATLTVRNTIVAGNVTQDIQQDGGTLVSTGHNLIGVSNVGGSFNQTGDQTGVANPKLSPLGNYGGRTQTHALQPGSPAINLGNPAFDPNAFTPPLTTDQRGVARVQGGRLDIGAYESGNAAGLIALLWETLPPGSNVGDYSPTGDKDGDGRNNLVEYAMLSNPFSSDSAPLVTLARNLAGTTGTMVLPIRLGAPDLIYLIDFSTNLGSPWTEIARYHTATATFTPLVSNLGASFGANNMTFTDGNLTGVPRGFYRLRVQSTAP